jgi:hypothetical protein
MASDVPASTLCTVEEFFKIEPRQIGKSILTPDVASDLQNMAPRPRWT